MNYILLHFEIEQKTRHRANGVFLKIRWRTDEWMNQSISHFQRFKLKKNLDPRLKNPQILGLRSAVSYNIQNIVDRSLIAFREAKK